MTTWAIGDIQGCYDSLRALLDRVAFDPERDHLWLVGDLVNRGPQSLETLRFARSLGDRVVAVLGNHDIHLLGLAAGVVNAKRSDTLTAVLNAPDAAELLDWVAGRPIVVDTGHHLLVHAGVYPLWTLHETTDRGNGVHRRLADPRTRNELLATARLDEAAQVSATTDPLLRDAQSLSTFTRIRVCAADGRIDHKFKDVVAKVPSGFWPWYAMPRRVALGRTVVFGHWAAHGAGRGADWIALDSGCVWGERLTAWSPDGDAFVDVPASERTP